MDNLRLESEIKRLTMNSLSTNEELKQMKQQLELCQNKSIEDLKVANDRCISLESELNQMRIDKNEMMMKSTKLCEELELLRKQVWCYFVIDCDHDYDQLLSSEMKMSPSIDSSLSLSSEFKGSIGRLMTINREDDNWNQILVQWRASLNTLLPCYVSDRLSAGFSPIHFDLVSIQKVVNPLLQVSIFLLRESLMDVIVDLYLSGMNRLDLR